MKVLANVAGIVTEVDVQEGSTPVLSSFSCEASVYVGAAVRIDRTSPGDIPMSDWTSLALLFSMEDVDYTVIAKNALADSEANSLVAGIVIAKSSPTLCDISLPGLTTAIFFSLDVLEEYYLSDVYPGALVKLADAPSASGTVKVKVGRAVDTSRLLVVAGDRIINP